MFRMPHEIIIKKCWGINKVADRYQGKNKQIKIRIKKKKQKLYLKKHSKKTKKQTKNGVIKNKNKNLYWAITANLANFVPSQI